MNNVEKYEIDDNFYRNMFDNSVEQCNNVDIYMHKLVQHKLENNDKFVEHYQKMIDEHTCFICRENNVEKRLNLLLHIELMISRNAIFDM